MSSAAYQPVSLPNGLPHDDDDEEFQDEPHSRVEPLEMGEEHTNQQDKSKEALLLGQVQDHVVGAHLALAVTTYLVCPALLMAMAMAYQIIGRIWALALCSLHLTVNLMKARCHMNELASFNQQATKNSKPFSSSKSNYSDNGEAEEEAASETNGTDEEGITSGVSREYNAGISPSSKRGCTYFCLTSLPSLLDILLFSAVYPIINLFFSDFFVDADGTLVYDWVNYYHLCQTIITLGWIVVVARICLGGRMIVAGIPASTYYLTTTYYFCQSIPLGIGKCFQFCYYNLWIRFKICFSQPPRPLVCWRVMSLTSVLASTLFFGWTIFSVVIHFGPLEPQLPRADLCDPVDATQCCLPFPSFFHLKEDPTTDTGYRVNLSPEAFPTLRGRLPIPVDFLNQLDGFSTMGPLLFYMEGMKESHEQYLDNVKTKPLLQKRIGETRLRGHEEMHLSVLPYSTTQLLDIDDQVLVPHSAEIDQLDPERPLVMVFPSRPLKHNTHYALAVINATDAKGNRLPPTPGMEAFWKQSSDRKEMYEKTILPALEKATHQRSSGEVNWGGPFGSFSRSKDPQALQLMFDFHTVSKQSQLGPVRAVRDATMKHITEPDWKWDDHARALRQVEGNCDDLHYPLARTIHGEIDVPWFMLGFGPGYRETILDSAAVEKGVPTTIGKAKFVAYVPCSLKMKALDKADTIGHPAQPLRAVVEYGHGLFDQRAEAGERFMIDMANRNGYVIIAMDWRGMSHYDYPLVMKIMLAEPSLFLSVRDNLIQGYANKYALQHFSQNGMLDKEWFQFSQEGDATVGAHKIPQLVQLDKSTNSEGSLPSVFYGISQGGILGAGYMGLSGSTGLISRGVLGVPGTSFAFILSRSLQFVGYDMALLMNFYDNRDVRIFLSLAQMCWDSVEGAGVLGQPVEEPVPAIILQAGLGDAIVPSLAAERLARALGAQTLPHNPRGDIEGINVAKPEDNPHTVLTEFLYQEDYEGLPKDNELTAHWNRVHLCVRLEPVLQRQIDVFFNEGRVTDPCDGDGTCVRKRAMC